MGGEAGTGGTGKLPRSTAPHLLQGSRNFAPIGHDIAIGISCRIMQRAAKNHTLFV
jgi:hypothetical protein